MKKILLVALNAKYIHSNPALYSLSRTAGGINKGIHILELTINNRYEDIISAIYNENPDVIGFSVYIWNAGLMKDVMADLRRLCPETLMFAGGPEATNDARTYLTLCDFVMLGEGEKNFAAICEALQNDTALDFSAMTGVAYHTGGLSQKESTDDFHDIIINAADNKGLASMDDMPFLYDKLEPFENRIIYYESSRGCPFRCSYCLSSIEKSVRFRSLDVVLREIQFFLDKGVHQVKFIDRTFNASHDRTKAIWQYIMTHDNGKTNFHFEIGADLLSDDEITLLSTCRPGLIQLEIGIQSTNPRTLEAIHRVTDNDRLFQNVRRLRKPYNINLHTDLIAGLPYEGFDSFRKSFNDIYPLYADQLQLGFLKVLKGTEMYQKAESYGLIWSKKAPYEVFSTRWLACDETIRLHHICDAVEVFYNSQMFRHTLAYLENFFESPFAMFERLADLLLENGLIGVGVSSKKSAELLRTLAVDDSTMTYLEAYITWDQRLHMHQSRKMSARETLLLPEGPVTMAFDYSRIHPVTGEAACHIVDDNHDATDRK